MAVVNYAPGVVETDMQRGARSRPPDEFPWVGLFLEFQSRGLVVTPEASAAPGSGEPSPTRPLSETTTKPIVTIGGQPATVLFSGLTPGYPGLYQINAVVPNTGAGSQPVTVSIGGVQSTVSHLPVR